MSFVDITSVKVSNILMSLLGSRFFQSIYEVLKLIFSKFEENIFAGFMIHFALVQNVADKMYRIVVELKLATCVGFHWISIMDI